MKSYCHNKEDNRRYRRVAFDHAKWKEHRSAHRYTDNFLTMASSRIFRDILYPTLWCLGLSVALGTYETALADGLLPPQFPTLTWSHGSLLTLSSFALSLLLVFRTNSSYARFDEARKFWGGILNRSRDMARQAVTYFPPEFAEHKAAVGRWLIAFCRCMRVHLQDEGDLVADLQGVLHPEELTMLLASPHKPNTCLLMLSEVITAVRMSESTTLQMTNNITFFHDQLGGCERLLRTPLPISYTRHTERFLMIWLTCLPFALWREIGWATPVMEVMVATLLLGIDEIGIDIEEPFGILPLEGICDRVQLDVEATLKQDTMAKASVGRLALTPVPALAAAAGARPGSNVVTFSRNSSGQVISEDAAAAAADPVEAQMAMSWRGETR